MTNNSPSPLNLLRAVDWNRFMAEHVTRSGGLTVWLVLLGAFTLNYVMGRLAAAPLTTTLVLITWAVTVSLTVFSEIRHKHSFLTWWLRNNLYNSITNILITLVLVLGILSVLFGLYRYAWETASFTRIPDTERRADSPERVADEFCFNVGGIDAEIDPTAIVDGERQCFPLATQTAGVDPATIGREAVTVCFDALPDDPENGETCFASSADDPAFFTVTNQFSGANWGAVAANMTTMMVFRYDRNELWRVYASVYLLVLLLIPTQFVYRASFTNKPARNLVTTLWFLSPIIIFILLRGVQPHPVSETEGGTVLGEMFRWEATRLGNNWFNTMLVVVAAAVAIWLNRRVYQRLETTRQVTPTWQSLRLLLDWVMAGTVIFALYRLYGMLIPLFRANLHILALVLFLVCAGGWWLWNRQFPFVEKESGWKATGRVVLRAGSIVFGLMFAYTVITLLGYGLASLTRTVEGESRPLLGYVDPSVNWGGFLLTLIISVFAIVVSFPIGLVLALGRRSQIRGIPAWLTYSVALIIMVWGLMTLTPAGVAAARNSTERILAYWPIAVPILAYLFQRSYNGNVLAAFSTLYIEFIRGIPLIAVLFLTITLFPILLPPDVEILNTWRVLWGFALFSAAYLAENVRGGLQAIPRGQYEAADSLGLNTFDKYRLIILPQAIRIVIPALVGQFVGLFKDTTLVAIVGLLDILGVANAISAQPQWLGVRREAYLFLAALYFVGSAIMVAYSRRLERRRGLGER